jgi:hypothetical protein
MITTEIETITPEIAHIMLGKNNKNRNLVDVKRFESLLVSHQFVLTHQGIAFDDDGNLLDGQTRLQAIKNTGIPAKMMVTRGLPKVNQNGTTIKTMDCIDCGRPRSIADQLSVGYGIKNTTKNAAAARAVLFLVTSEPRIKLTSTTAAFILNQYEYIRELSSIADSHKSLMSGSVVAAVGIAAKSRPDIMETFVAPYIKGQNLHENSPVLVYRNYIIKNIGSRLRGNRPDMITKLLVTLNAILAHIEGGGVQRISTTSNAGLLYFASMQNELFSKIAEISGYKKASFIK